MFPWQCEDLSINHLTLLLVVTMPYASWFLWRADYIEDFKWHLHFQLGVAFWRVVLRELYFEEPNHVWRALKASLLNIGTRQTLSTPYELWGGGVSNPGGGSLPGKILTCPKTVARPAQLPKKIALAFLKAAWLQIPYWVHFTFKVQNPIYMCTSK